MAKILVTGGAGFIGSHVVDLFVSRGYDRIFSTLAKVTDYPHLVQYGPAKVGETRLIFLDASKAKKELGWAPTFTLEEGLQETVNYFRTIERAV